jgi:hypothetical protein
MPRGVAQTCRHFGLSRKTFYKWKARYKSYGEAGLCDRPRVPQRFQRAAPRESAYISSQLSMTARAFECSRSMTPATNHQPFVLWTRSSDTPLSGAARLDGQWLRVPIQLPLAPGRNDIRHVYIRPRTLHLNGKVVRSHRVDEQEFYQLLDKDGITDDIACSTISFANGRTTTTTTSHMEVSKGKRPTSDSWQRNTLLGCHRSLETLQLFGRPYR